MENGKDGDERDERHTCNHACTVPPQFDRGAIVVSSLSLSPSLHPLTRVFDRCRYSRTQILSSLVICAGIISLTLADSQTRKLPVACCGETASSSTPLTSESTPATLAGTTVDPAAPSPSRSDLLQLPWLGLGLGPLLVSVFSFDGVDLRWLIGIGMLTTTLLMLSTLGHFQERTYAKYGKVWRGQTERAIQQTPVESWIDSLLGRSIPSHLSSFHLCLLLLSFAFLCAFQR